MISQLPDMRKTALIAFGLAAITVACAQEPDLHLDLKDKTRPSFSFSGRSLATAFEILEVPRSEPLSKINPYTVKGRTVWRISMSRRVKAADWPSVIYGEVPNGLSQGVPEQGPPPKLTQGKLYLARIVGEQGFRCDFFFEVRNNLVVNVTDKVFGP